MSRRLSQHASRLLPRRAALAKCASWMALWTPSVWADMPNDAPLRMSAIEVVATREALTQPTLAMQRDAFKAMPGGVSLVDLVSVREGRQSTWTDSLGLAPGVYVQDRFGSEEARISVRGSALSRTYHSFGLKVLQDGVPINFGDGFFDMQTVDPSASRYVEVLRGANAATYGATTLGGAINFVAPTGRSEPGQKMRVEAGSFGYLKWFGSVAGASGPQGVDHYVSASQTQQAGYRDHASMSSQKWLGNVGVRVDRDLETRFYVGLVRSRTQLPGYLTWDQLQTNPRQANNSQVGAVFPYREDNNQRRDVDSQRIANKTTWRDPWGTWELAAYAMNYSLWHPIATIVVQNAKTQGGHLKRTEQHGTHQRTWGYLPSWGETVGTSSPSDQQGGAVSAPTSAYRQQSNNQSLFVQDRWAWRDATALTMALHYDQAKRQVSDALLASNNLSATYRQWSPRLGLVHGEADQQWFASIGRNFEPPIFGLAGTSTTVNDAQRGTTVEVGTRGEAAHGRHQWMWDATLYRTALSQEFQTACSNPPLCSLSATQNLAHTRHQGLELGGRHVFDRQWDTRASLLYSDFRFVDHPVYGHQRMPGFHPVLLRAESLWRGRAATERTAGSYFGPKVEWAPLPAPMDNTHSLFSPGYAIWGLKAGRSIDPTWSWFADARNLANRRYAATTNISANYAGTVNPAAYYPGEGRAVYVGVTATLP